MTPAALESRRRYLAAELGRYWGRAHEAVLRLPVPAADEVPHALPPRLQMVVLPEWAADLGAEGGLLVPAHCVPTGLPEPWRAVDWWSAAYWYLNGVAEREHERQHGEVHSYAFRLKGWDARMWERAWVNRIALFLRRWTARELSREETALFGPVPAAEILLTHDVDAIRKTAAIRMKQTAFHGYNAMRLAGGGRFHAAFERLATAVRFLLSSPDYWHFEEIEAAEEQARVKSCFLVYGGIPRGRSLRLALLDPGYDVCEARIAAKLRDLSRRGWEVGLHQSFDAWRDDAAMAREKARVEEALGAGIAMCRQHWLRFSWRDTWKAQQAAGLETDATLGFNDRPGFRNGAALRFHPHEDAGAMRIASLPMLLMDSQVYDYASLSQSERRAGLRYWLDEVRAVSGTATVIWHQHTLGPDYGWRTGFDEVLELSAAGSAR